MADFVLGDSSLLTVNSDCTAVGKGTMVPKGSSQALPAQDIDRGVVLNGGDEIIVLISQGTLGAPVIIGNLKRISMTPAATSW